MGKGIEYLAYGLWQKVYIIHGICYVRILQTRISGIPLMLGLGTRMRDPCVSVLFWALPRAEALGVGGGPVNLKSLLGGTWGHTRAMLC